ncbi:MAG: hypothetical protein J5742_03395 [Alphaproteobacteria bacterium]|nr:hypothetical protein [Alphaproteobacteria bacterium]
MERFIHGGFFANRKIQIMTCVGIVSALCAYLVGDSDIYATAQAIIAVCGVYWLHKSKTSKGK